MQPLKLKIHTHCVDFLKKRIAAIDTIMKNCQDAANSESKNSAGDKHETGRAMAQLDRENHAVQRVAALNTLAQLRSIDLSRSFEEADTGAIIRSDKGSFFMAISAGKIELDGELIHLISVDSPIGQALLGAEEEDTIRFRNRDYEILEIF